MKIVKQLIRKILPSSFLSLYHYTLSIMAAVYYRHPSNKMTVIGVTGTNGKTTVVHLVSRILEGAGHKVGHISSIDFKVGSETWKNTMKMTMPGRFYMQKLLARMKNAGCEYVVLEVTSEGIKQFRHNGISFDVGVFTNLTPEHIENHGGFENYKKAKLKFFRHLENDGKDKKILVVNSDSEYVSEFLDFKVDEKCTYGLKNNKLNLDLKLKGEFNLSNALAAVEVAEALGVNGEVTKRVLEGVRCIPGRMEFIDEGQPFQIVVDYAHTPDALNKVYESLKSSKFQVPSSRMICVLGAAGGGRDKWKRPELGRIAAEYCDEIILTNEDPYNENPEVILDDVERGLQVPGSKFSARGRTSLRAGKIQYSRVLDRREAIKKALSLANPSDTVVITGKGAENKMMVGDGWIEWDDREVVREEL